MRLRSAPQFHATLAYGDAVGNDCFELQRLMWHDGVRSELFAEESKPEVRALARPWRDLEKEPTERTALFVHVSMGNDALDGVTALPHRKVVVHHNITPASYFSGLNEHAERYAARGREQLKALASVAERRTFLGCCGGRGLARLVDRTRRDSRVLLGSDIDCCDYPR